MVVVTVSVFVVAVIVTMGVVMTIVPIILRTVRVVRLGEATADTLCVPPLPRSASTTSNS